MQRFDECFEDLPDPRADNALHDLTEILFIVKRTAGGLLAKRRFKGRPSGRLRHCYRWHWWLRAMLPLMSQSNSQL
ncbi:hypothetical protein DXU07_31280 [Bradyrhizobium elkanii]